jgi:hypothetical protein
VTFELHILNLGAGVQSTWLYLLSMRGDIQRFDYAIISDTQDEIGGEERRQGLPDPEESFYAHLDWLGTQAAFLDSKSPLVKSSNHGGYGCPILVRTRGQISSDLLRDDAVSPNHPNGDALTENMHHRFATIPAYTAAIEGRNLSIVPRQCTKEYKIEVIERAIRYELLGLSPGDRLPKDMVVHQYIGISWDERSRAYDIARRFETADKEDTVQEGLFGEETVISVTTGRRQKANWRVHFPLIEDGRMLTRDDCDRELQHSVPHKVYGSACIMCPFKDDPTWARHMQQPTTHDALIRIDAGMRAPNVLVSRDLKQKLYLHKACKPIDKIDFGNEKQNRFAMECEGGCGL